MLGKSFFQQSGHFRCGLVFQPYLFLVNKLNTAPQPGHAAVWAFSAGEGDFERFGGVVFDDLLYDDIMLIPFAGFALRAVSRVSTKAIMSGTERS